MEIQKPSEIVSPQELDSFIDEIYKTPTKEKFNSAMKRFEESFMNRYKATNLQTRGKFPFGSSEYFSSSILPSNPIPQPYSNLDLFYQNSKNLGQYYQDPRNPVYQDSRTQGLMYQEPKPQGLYYQPSFIEPQSVRYEDPYRIPMHERGTRSQSPGTFIRTEYVPYPYPYHPPYEYVNHGMTSQQSYKRNPLKESIELRKVKEELFNQTIGSNPKNNPQTLSVNTRYQENPANAPENFRFLQSKNY